MSTDDKIMEFKDLRGDVPDERIAEMAGVTLEEVLACWAGLDAADAGDAAGADVGAAEATEAPEDVDTPTTDEPAADSDDEAPAPAFPVLDGTNRDVKAAVASGDLDADLDALEAAEIAGQNRVGALGAIRKRRADLEAAKAPAPAAPTAPKAPPCPPAVRLLRSALVKRADGRTWRLGRRDVYSGDDARFLWRNHRELLEPYPPAE